MPEHSHQTMPPKVWMLVSGFESPLASGFRQERWGHIFLDAGWRVTFFQLNGFLSLKEDVFTSSDQLTSFRQKALQIARSIGSVREGILVRILRSIKHTFLVDLYLPNVLKLLITTARRLRLETGPVVVMASSPGFAHALVGAILKAAFPGKINLVVDMRDAWALHPALRRGKLLKKIIERWVLSQADRILTVSVGLKREFESAYDLPDVLVFYNVATQSFGSGRQNPADLTALDPRISNISVKLVYTGSTPEGFYDTQGLADAVHRFHANSPDRAKRIQFIFLGICQPVQDAVAQYPELSDMFIFLPLVKPEKARSIQAGADALLFFAFDGENNKGVVSAKFFEYLASGTPILPVSIRKDSDLDFLLERFAGGSLRINTVEEIAECLDSLVEKGPQILPRVEEPSSILVLFDDYKRFPGELVALSG